MMPKELLELYRTNPDPSTLELLGVDTIITIDLLHQDINFISNDEPILNSVNNEHVLRKLKFLECVRECVNLKQQHKIDFYCSDIDNLYESYTLIIDWNTDKYSDYTTVNISDIIGLISNIQEITVKNDQGNIWIITHSLRGESK